MVNKISNRCLGFTLLFALSACGGSGSGDSSNIPVQQLSPLEITATNAVQVFQEGFISLELVLDILMELVRSYDTTPPNAGPVTTMCSGGGSNTLTFNDSDSDGNISSGDSIIDTDSACTESGIESNGTIVTTLESLTDSANGRYQGTFEFQNVVFTENTGGLGFSGTIDFDLIINGSSILLNALTVDSVILGVGTSANPFKTETELKINSLIKLDTSLSLDVEIESEFLSGTFNIVSPSTLVFNAGEYPTAGVLRIEGANTNADVSGNATSNAVASVIIRQKNGTPINTVLPAPSWPDLSADVLINLP